MKRLVVLLTIVITAMVTSTVAVLSNDQAAGAATLNQIDQSGIEARILFLDTGSPLNMLIVSGEASGLDPEQAYISLIYDQDALPRGPRACLPSSNPLTGAQMSVGAWTVSEDGTGTLFAIKTGPSYAPLSDIGAMSVRLSSRVLQACGRVQEITEDEEEDDEEDEN